MLDPLYELIAHIIVAIHGGLAPVFGKGSGWSWGLAIVFLTMLMRLALFPLFVKQIKTQRAMQTLQPKMKELQAKYKGDRETLNVEMMKLYKEHGANPLTGCLPLLLQMPVFFALFHVLNGIKPNSQGQFSAHSGISADLVASAAHAKVFGAPIAASFKSSADLLGMLNASPTTVKIVAAIMVVLMGGTTFWTQRQLMARTAANGGTAIAAQQKIILYVLPFSFLFAGFNFPIGVLLYWLTTNLWSMAQQHFVIAKMGAYGPATAGGPAAGGPTLSPPAPSAPAPRLSRAPKTPTNGSAPSGVDGAKTPVSPGGAAARRTAGNRHRKGRRGGRR